MATLLIMNSDIRMTVNIAVNIQHCATLKEATDMAREAVARICSERLGIVVGAGTPILDDWSVEGNCGDKTYVLKYIFTEPQGREPGSAVGISIEEELARR